MNAATSTIERVVRLLSKLPGVGEKTAQRYALFLLTCDESTTRELALVLGELRDKLRPCVRCGNIAEISSDPTKPAICAVCTDSKRDGSVLCIVGRVHDLLAIERTGAMRGRYFVLGKLLSPLEGVGPEHLPIAKLVDTLKENGAREVIVATPPSVDGEATALFLKRELEPLNVQLTRIASGVPHGGDLEYADPITMRRALSGRQKL